MTTQTVRCWSCARNVPRAWQYCAHCGKYKNVNSTLELMVRELEKRKSVHGDTVSFRPGFVDPTIRLLSKVGILRASLSERDRWRIGFEAIFAAAKQPLTCESLLKEIRLRTRAFFGTRPGTFALVSTVSILPQRPARNVIVEEGKLTLWRSLKRFDRSELSRHPELASELSIPKQFSVVVVTVKGRSADDGFARGRHLLDMWRASLNLTLNRGGIVRYGHLHPRPVNQIRLGPMQTLHGSDGKLATTDLWHETQLSVDQGSYDARSTYVRLARQSRILRRFVSASSYRKDLSSALVRYVRALDTTDHEVSFLKLWSLLEFLTGTDNKESDHTETVGRCANVFPDREESHVTLDSLREVRNEMVHRASTPERMFILLSDLRPFVEGLLTFHIASRETFRSMSNAGHYLSITREEGRMREHMKFLRMALRGEVNRRKAEGLDKEYAELGRHNSR